MLKFKDFGEVDFEKSIVDNKNFPNPRLSEIAFAGRSNVGKSSLLNSLFNRKNLVKTSSTPGKTQLINYFNVKSKFFCVDLPGYGYAKLPKKIKEKWRGMIENYLVNNAYLKNIYLLIDSRHDIMSNDKEMIDWLLHEKLNFSIILSKCDKIKKHQQSLVLNQFHDTFPEIPILAFSIKQNDTIKKLRTDIINIINP